MPAATCTKTSAERVMHQFNFSDPLVCERSCSTPHSVGVQGSQIPKQAPRALGRTYKLEVRPCNQCINSTSGAKMPRSKRAQANPSESRHQRHFTASPKNKHQGHFGSHDRDLYQTDNGEDCSAVTPTHLGPQEPLASNIVWQRFKPDACSNLYQNQR